MVMVKTFLETENLAYAGQTVKQTLNQLIKEQNIYTAGKGWYSTIASVYSLDTEPIDPFIEMMAVKYPLLPFCCWSTGQLRSHAHHMLSRYVTFLYLDRDFMPDIFEYVRTTDYHAYLNPTRKEAKKNFRIETNTLVIRPSISRQPQDIHYATIEKILVDLLVESENLWIMEKSEYNRIFNNLLFRNRIDVSLLLKYSQIRKVRPEVELLLNIP